MAYFLKKSKLKKGLYLQIYFSYYDSEKKSPANKSYKAIGYFDNLIKAGIADPIAYYQAEVDKLNVEFNKAKKQKRDRKIGVDSSAFHLGYFPIKSINDGLQVKQYLDMMQKNTNFKFNLYSALSSLIYARIVHPCSKLKTYEKVFPRLYDETDISLSQVYSMLEYAGSQYEKIIEIYNNQIDLKYPFETPHVFFDCTNFYFEIDREDEFRKKGTSKENRRDPLVGMGLLLDANQIPLGMKLYPGNESEKPVIRNIINDLKQRNRIVGRTIQVADKGLNCGDNIKHALDAGDGYIFSKSPKMISKTEREWILSPDGWQDVFDSNGKLIYRIKEKIDDYVYKITDENGRKKNYTVHEKHIVSYNPKLAAKHLAEIDKEIAKAKNITVSEAKHKKYGDKAKYLEFKSVGKDDNKKSGKVIVGLNADKIRKDREIAGYNILVTSEILMPAKEIYNAYHLLWRIEESFRVLKSQLEARPVFVQKMDTIKGHFLVCYLSIVLVRLLQFKILENKYGSESIWEFMHDFNVTKISEQRYINNSFLTPFIEEFAELTQLPLTSFFLNSKDVKNISNYKF